MPNRPSIYRRSKPDADRTINKKDRDEPASGGFYTSRKWRNFRASLLEKRREQDLKFILDNYPDNTPKVTLRNLENWKASGLPYCKLTWERYGTLSPARILDHIIPWESGKTRREKERLKWNKENLQFLNEHEHARKSGEDQKYYNL